MSGTLASAHESALDARVFENHLVFAQLGDVETDLARNLAPDCVLLTSYAVFHGQDGAWKAAALLDAQIGKVTYTYRTMLFHGELAFLEWSATTDRESINGSASRAGTVSGRPVRNVEQPLPDGTFERPYPLDVLTF